MAAPTIVGSTTFATNDASISTSKTVVFHVPAGTVTGDYLIAAIAATDVVTAAPVAPAEWTELAAWTESGTLMYQAWAAPYTPSLNLAFISTNMATATRILPCSITVRGAAPIASWVKGTIGRRIDQGTSTYTTAPTITTTVADTLVMGLFSERTTATETDITSVTGATKNAFLSVFNNGAIETLTVTESVKTTPGTTASVVVTYPNTQASNGMAQQIGIPPVVASGTPPVADFTATHMGLRVGFDASPSTDVDGDIDTYSWNFGDGKTGAGKMVSHLFPAPGTYTVDLTVQDEGSHSTTTSKSVVVVAGEDRPFLMRSSEGLIAARGFIIGPSGAQHPVKEVRALAPGYASVDTMLAQDTFFVAHRGGSQDFPEMSLHAYTQSVARGYGALEVSLGRSVDGVWFGLHDETLDRTSGTTSALASTMTWAEIQQHPIMGSLAPTDPDQPDRPFMRLEEILEWYYSTHVLFIDPKYQLSRRTELLNILDALPGTPQDRIVIKYFGVDGNTAGTTGLAADAAARGYERWGYFYEGSDIATYQGRWSILGMSYAAPQASWDAIKAYGKPVIAHICPTLADAATALTKGADGLMCSGVKAIRPAQASAYVNSTYDAAIYDTSLFH